MTISYTLLSDGSSDRALMNIIDWVIRGSEGADCSGRYADLSLLKNPPSAGELDKRIAAALILYPCDILFVHRDSETRDKATFENRKKEIEDAFQKYGEGNNTLKCVKIVPVVMMESWLLFNINAIKKASGNRNSRANPSLPRINRIEKTLDTKSILRNALKDYSGLKGRRLNSFNVSQAIHRVAEFIDDFSPLRGLDAFNEFEKETIEVVDLLIRQ